MSGEHKKAAPGEGGNAGNAKPHRRGATTGNISSYRGSFKRLSPDIGRLERALVGAALNHVDETLNLKRRGFHPDQLEDPQLREILRACYALEPLGLRETPEPTAQVILDHLHHRGVNVTAYDLGKVADGAAWPGAHFERIFKAWGNAYQVRQQVQRLEDLAERARNGEAHPAEITNLIGGGDE